MNKNLFKAFTLIELLVVIAIIGILSGLIIVGMSGATDRAITAKAQVFSNSLRDSLLNDLISEWKFDEASGATVNDFWGNNTGTITGASWETTTANCIYGTCLSFSGGVNDYVQLSAITTITTGTAFVLCAWANPQKGASYQTIMGYNSTHRLLIQDSGTMLSQQDGAFYSATGAITYNKWSYIVYWNDGTQEKWYINGTLSGTPHNTAFAEWDAAFKMGQYDLINYPYKGRIDEVRIYDNAIPISQIQQNYFAGINKLIAKQGISQKEYQERLAQLNSNHAKH
ncbi:MAG: prepilin-type N-terminal cleavage/methylation domain-containing protein [Candidatus Pacebacteria bacterium]|nr:prepilin-type N-terminal cleavage/methylation domain-containing protein [Candidatus Paceibacterota bacterium]